MSEKLDMNDLNSVSGGVGLTSDGKRYTNSFAAGTLCNDVWKSLEKFNREAKRMVQNYIKSSGLQKYHAGKARYVLKKNVNIELVDGKFLEVYVNNVQVN